MRPGAQRQRARGVLHYRLCKHTVPSSLTSRVVRSYHTMPHKRKLRVVTTSKASSSKTFKNFNHD